VAIQCPKCHYENPGANYYCNNCGNSLRTPQDIPETKTMEIFPDELASGATFAGRYQIIEEIGKGDIGRVYKAYDTKIKEKIALKLIKPEIARDKRTTERLSNEIRLARKIKHKNICQVFDLGEEKGAHFITMEYISGATLDSMIRMSGRLAVGTTINIAKQMAEGLAEAHRIGIVHRDLKSGNVMIDREGNIFITDFGIARSLESKGIAAAGAMIGTPEYMSPEQATGKDVDQRSDIYSLGVILYEMVTGHIPFEGDSPLDIADKHKNKPPPHPRTIHSQIPEDLNRVILKCLEKDKSQRFQTAKEVLVALSETGEIKTEAIHKRKWKNSIAVLPFMDLSPQKDQEYFCDGISEELIMALTQIKGLRVVARTSAFSFKGKDIDIREIGKKLNVERLLEGSIRKAGNRLRITAQLINVEDGYHVWSEQYDRDLDDVFAIQGEISLAIVEKLKAKLLGEEKERLLKRYTEDLEAYSLYLKGRYSWNKRTGEGMKRAIAYFQQAIEKDPDYAMAYTGLADSYILLPYYYSFPPKEAYPKAKQAAKQALKKDQTLAEAHTSLGMVKACYDWDWSGAEKEFEKAIELNKNYSLAHFWYAWSYVWRARLDVAIERINNALDLDPLSLPINADLGVIYHYKRQYDRAIEQYNKTLEIEPEFIYTHLYLGWGYLLKSKYKEALAEFLGERKLSKEWNAHVETWIGITYAQMGKRDKAREVLDELIKRSKQTYISPYLIGLFCFVMGENDHGFEWLDKAYEERDYWMCWLKIEPLFDSVRTDARFKTLLKKIGFDK
jgi:serine/threonine protein kinase/tetratricopeptide (TPR) repeat protein